MHRRRLFKALAAAGSLAGAAAPCLRGETVSSPAAPEIPAGLAADLPAACRQVVLVLSPELRSVPARLWLLERADERAVWQASGGSIAVSLGRSGLGWGTGGHRAPAPAGFPLKREGDGRSPAGVFEIPFAFGRAPVPDLAAAGMRLKYRFVTETLFGVDDGDSAYYNQVVDAREVRPDWKSAETMLQREGLYRLGAFVGHNPRREKGGGSCIFLHIWRGPGRPTTGCTAMAEAGLKRVLFWLDPAKHPRLVQTVAPPRAGGE